jgi:hypothetical protein
VNGIVFLISFSTCSLLVYRKSTDFCMLILHPVNLPKVFIRSKGFLMKSLRSFKYRIISLTNRGNLSSFFPICIHFIYFSCLIAVTKISSIIMNKSGENGQFDSV